MYPGGAAADVINQITGLDPDYIIHLGDVYYSGTGGDFLPLNEEWNNLLNLWPQPAPPSFALNSNHEMYAGAKGYFEVALADSRFSQQQGTSYFALQYSGWTLLGLDSAYYSTSPLYMLGSIGGATEPRASGSRIWALFPERNRAHPSHRAGLRRLLGGDPVGRGQCRPGGDPAAWYWGHVHKGSTTILPR